eukprot:scaffold10084_cov64-Phaeocystis_antarctica.AAC.2
MPCTPHVGLLLTTTGCGGLLPLWKTSPTWPASAAQEADWPRLAAPSRCCPGLAAPRCRPGSSLHRPAAAVPHREAVAPDAAAGNLLPRRREQRAARGVRQPLQRTIRRALALPLLLS